MYKRQVYGERPRKVSPVQLDLKIGYRADGKQRRVLTQPPHPLSPACLLYTSNAGTGNELTIKELTELVAKVVGYTGEIKWDPTKPNGTPRKPVSYTHLAAEDGGGHGGLH